MNATQLLTVLQAQGVELAADGDKLKIDAPRGAITSILQTQLRIHKQELLDMLKPPTLPGLLTPRPTKWVDPDIGGYWLEQPAAAWAGGLVLYRDGFEPVTFNTPAELQAATLEDTRLPLPESSGWVGGNG